MAQPARPVIVAGAGPVGLMAALVLQRRGVRSIIVERAVREKLVADVGSGYNLQPTAMRVLNTLDLPFREHFQKYAGLRQLRLDNGQMLRAMTGWSNIADDFEAWAVQRSGLQLLLLEALQPDWAELRCGAGIASYEERDDEVEVCLSDGTKLFGSALLGCDGVKSAVRAQMHQHTGDSLHYCGIRTWWAKSEAISGTHLDELLGQSELKTPEGLNLVWFMGAGSTKGCFLAAPYHSEGGTDLMWAFSCLDDAAPEDGDDLTRRGGLTGARAKEALLPMARGCCELARRCIEETPSEQITMVGLCDRSRLDLPFASAKGLVALLGDAAHPQTPFLGQGASSGIVDAFVCATYLATSPTAADALRSYDSAGRREGVKNMVLEARNWANLACSESSVVRLGFRLAVSWLPQWLVLRDMLKQDKTNKDFFEKVLADRRLDETPMAKL